MNQSFRKTCFELSGVPSTQGKCLVVAEVAETHDGSLGLADAFIDAIANTGADAVKFQTHIAAEESTPSEPWRVKFSKQDATRFDYWKRMEFTAEQWLGLKQHADEKGLIFMSSAFSESAVDLLGSIGMKVWKVGSGEVCNFPLLKNIAEQNGAVILSSGMSDWSELDEAVDLVRSAGNPLAVLQCTTAYPCPPEAIGLNLIGELRQRYGLAVGLSDHSGTIFPGLAAATLGADVLEVHVTMSREMFGPDVSASVTTDDLRQLIVGVRQIERMIDSPVDKNSMSGKMTELRTMFTKSVVAGSDLPAGTVLSTTDLKFKKPGTGMPASQIDSLIGRTLRREVKMDEFVQLTDLEK